MNWGTGLSLVLVLVGVGLVVTTPSAPQYGVSVEGPEEVPAEEPIVSFENLTEDERQTFRDALDGIVQSYGDPPPTPPEYVRYEGDAYRVVLGASESTLRTFLQTPVGILIALIGGVALAVSRR